MRINLVVLSVALCLCGMSATAQKKKQAKDSTVVITFSETSTTSKKKKKASGDANIVKIAPLGFISGSFPLLYERKIADFLTIEAGAGLTHRNYMRGVFRNKDGVNLDESYDNTDIAEGSYKFDNRKAVMGYMFRVMPKIYFESEAPEGSYLGLQYNYGRYNFEIPRLDANEKYTGQNQSEYENISDLMVYFGRQVVNDRITVDFSTGLGIRNVKGVKYTASHDSNGNLVDGLTPYKQTVFNYGMGLTIGYHF